MGLEFFVYNDELWCRHADGRTYAFDESKTELIDMLVAKIREFYPEAYAALEKMYSKSSINKSYYLYLIARRFCKCNFCKLDTTLFDIECDRSNFEKVECPLRGECPNEGIICMPKFNSSLSPAEERVMKLIYQGKEKDEISRELFISPETVKNHIKSAYVKLGVHSRAEFVMYASNNNLFTN